MHGVSLRLILHVSLGKKRVMKIDQLSNTFVVRCNCEYPKLSSYELDGYNNFRKCHTLQMFIMMPDSSSDRLSFGIETLRICCFPFLLAGRKPTSQLSFMLCNSTKNPDLVLGLSCFSQTDFIIYFLQFLVLPKKREFNSSITIHSS